jgi:hypothetical protein
MRVLRGRIMVGFEAIWKSILETEVIFNIRFQNKDLAFMNYFNY